MDRIEQENPAELKRKLGKRLGLAAVLIVILLGALAAFDHLSRMEHDDADTEPAVSAVPPRLGPSISSARPGDTVPPIDEPIKPSSTLMPKEEPVAVEPPPKPEVAAQPTVTTPPAAPAAVRAAVSPPQPIAAAPVVTQAARPAAPSSPAPISPAALRPSAPVAAPPAPAVPEGSSNPPMLGAPSAQPSTAGARPPTAPVAPPRPVLSRLAAGFVLQAGVFNSTERAEELKAKLVMAGVPVRIETRVQVGPFATQKEADAARQKIRQLGIDSIVIPPRAGRR